MYNFGRLDFPNQHVSYAEKQEVDWYAKCCDYVIEAGKRVRFSSFSL